MGPDRDQTHAPWISAVGLSTDCSMGRGAFVVC